MRRSVALIHIRARASVIIQRAWWSAQPGRCALCVCSAFGSICKGLFVRDAILCFYQITEVLVVRMNAMQMDILLRLAKSIYSFARNVHIYKIPFHICVLFHME